MEKEENKLNSCITILPGVNFVKTWVFIQTMKLNLENEVSGLILTNTASNHPWKATAKIYVTTHA